MSENKTDNPIPSLLQDTLKRLGGTVAGKMMFPDEPCREVGVIFQLYTSDEHPYKTANCEVERSDGNLIISFPGGLIGSDGKSQDTPAILIGFEGERITLEVYDVERGKTRKKVTVYDPQSQPKSKKR